MFSPRMKFLALLLPALSLLAASLPAEAQAVSFGTEALGQTSSAQSATLTFTGAGSVASQLALTNGAQKQDFAIVSGGSCATGQSYSAGNTCTVSVTFGPLYAGLRMGAVVLEDASGNVLASTYINGVGSGPQAGFHEIGGEGGFPYLGFTPDRGIAVDGNGNLFVASVNSATAKESVVEVPQGCTDQSCVKQLPGTFYAVWGLALDGAGNLWVGDVGAAGTITEIPASGGYSATKTYSGSFGNQLGMAVDGSGNLFFTGNSASTAYNVTELVASSGYSTVKTLASGYNGLEGIAVDGSGDVFFADSYDKVVKELVAVNGGIPTSPTINSIGSGLAAVSTVAVEGSGDLLVANASTSSAYVTEFLVSTGYTTSVQVGSSFGGPAGIAVTSGGDLYVVDFGTYGTSIVEVGRAAPPALDFGTATAPGETDTADGPLRVSVQNLGNQPLALSGLVFSNGNFSFDSGTTTCNPTATLAAGTSCTLGIEFTPVSTGSPITGTLSVDDNALNAAGAKQNLALTGVGLFTPVVNVLDSSTVVAVTQTLTLSVTVNGGNGNPTPTGNVQVVAVGYTSPTIALTNGTASLTVPAGSLTPGLYTIAINYVPDAASSAVYTSSVAKTNITVTSTILNVPNMTVTPAAPAVSQGQPLSVTVALLGANGAPAPTGTITLEVGNFTSPAAVISSGTVTITIPANTLTIGTDLLAAFYTPDSASATIYVPTEASGAVSVSATATSSGASPADFGSIGIGTTSAPQAVTLTFPSNSTPATLIATTQGAMGKDFAIVAGGSCGAGVNVAAGQSCTLNVTFTPAFAGLRNGAVVALDGSGQTLALTYIHGSGTGAQMTFQSDYDYAYYGIYATNNPFSFTTLSDGFSHPNVAVDGAGNVFEADLGTGAVEEIPVGCTNASCTITVLKAFYGPSALAVDGAGNIFVTEVGNGDVKKIPLGCRSYSCMQTIGSGFNQPYGLFVDSSGNIFVADTYNNAVKEVVAAGGYTTINTLATGLDLPWSVVVNAGGDLFVAEGGDQCTEFIPGSCTTINTSLLEIPAAGGYKTVNTLASGVFGKPFGLAIDGGGNVYDADYGDTCADEFTAGSGYTTARRLCSNTLLVFPEGMAVDSSDNLYLDDVIEGKIYKMDYVDPSAITFKTATLQGVSDVQDGPQLVSIQNNGTAPLTFSSIVLSDSSFTFDKITTCSAATPLAVGSSCYLALDYLPTRSGPISATITLVDNNLNQNAATQVIQITAVALAPAPVILTNPANPTTATTATFTFGDTQTPVTFVCSIDSLPYSACASPATYSALGGGPHAFQVKAKDFAGNLSNPAIYNWLVNSIGPPAPIITSAPAYITDDDTATFAFTDSQSGVSYQCSLDGTAFVACSSGVSYSGLAGFPNNYNIVTKRHTFAVKAMDGSGNFSPETIRAWTDISVPMSAYPVDFGLVPVGQTSSPQSVTFNSTFSDLTDGGPIATLEAVTNGVAGLDFTVTDPGTCAVGTSLPKGATCTLKATFTPKYPGQRKGAVWLLDASGTAIAEAYLQGTGTAPQVTFAPYSTVIYSILPPQNNPNPGLDLIAPATDVAVDGGGNVYATDEYIGSVDGTVFVSEGDIWKFPVGCTSGTCDTSVGKTLFPIDLKMDGAGVVWISSYEVPLSDLFTIGGNSFYLSECTDIPSSVYGFRSTAIDAAGNLALLGGGLLQSCYTNLGVGQTSQTVSFDFSTYTPSLAIDPQNNFIVADTGNNAIKQVLSSSGYTIDRSIGSGFNAPAGVASDAYGNIYVSDSGNNAIKEIIAASGYTQVQTLASLGSAGPTPVHLTVDALGNVFFASTNLYAPSSSTTLTGQLIKLDFSDAPALTFPTPTKIGTTDTTDGTLTATVNNSGNQPLTITGLALSNTNFSLDSSKTTCSTSAPVAVGGSCTVGLMFTPNGNGALTGTLTLTDNELNAAGTTHQFALSGTAFTTQTASTPTVTVTPNPSSITTAQSDTVSVTVSGKSGSPTPSGTVSLIGGNYTSATVTLSGGSATFTIPAGVLAVGSTTVNAVYTPDTASSTTYGVGAGSASISVSAITTSTPTVTVTPALLDITGQQSLAVTIAVSSGGGNPVPTGTVTLSGGNFSSLAVALTNGTAIITIPAGYLPGGSDTLTGYYTPDYVSQPNYKSAIGTGQVSVESAVKNTPAVMVTPALSAIQPSQSVQVTLQVAATSGNSTPTGTIVLSSGSYSSAAAVLAHGSVVLSIPAGALAVGSDTLTASYTPDAASSLTFNNASGIGSVTVGSGSAQEITPTVTVTPAPTSITTTQALTVTVAVSGGSSQPTVTHSVHAAVARAEASGNPTPTGSVIVTSGSYTSGATTLSGGSAMIAVPAGSLATGTDTLTATYTPDSGSSSTYNGATGTNTVNVTAATVQVTIGTSPTGLSFTVDSTTYNSAQTLSWTVGSTHTIATTSPQVSSGTQNTFASWSDAGALSHSVTAASSVTSYTASFSTAYLLTPSANPLAGGGVTPTAATYYPAGTVVSLTATPNSGYNFSGWTGSVASAGSASTTITMNAPQSVTANFTLATSAIATLTPPTLTFTAVTGATSASQVATLTNIGTATLNITGISIAGTNPSDFTIATGANACGTSLAVGASCSIYVTFTPATATSFAATLMVADNATTQTPSVVNHVRTEAAQAGSTQTISLVGTGTAAAAPAATLTPPTLTFTSTTGTASGAQVATLANSGNAALTITGITITGTNPGDFAITTGTNACGTSLAASSSCSIYVTFTPASATSFAATLSVADNASGSPQTTSLSGTGTAATAPAATLTPPVLTFTSTVGTASGAQVAALANSGNAALTITGISITGTNPGDFAITTGTNACGTSLAASSSCSIYVTFTPASATSFAATLSVADNASGSPQTTALTGTGTAAVTPTFTLSSPTAPQTVQPGGSATYTIAVTPQNGTFSNAVTFAVSGLPTGATASFSPASVTPGSTSANSTLTIQTSAIAKAEPAKSLRWPLAAPVLALIGIFFLPGKRSRCWITMGILLLASLGAVTALTGCGGGFGLVKVITPTSYNITVTGTSGSELQTTTVQLTVQ